MSPIILPDDLLSLGDYFPEIPDAATLAGMSDEAAGILAANAVSALSEDVYCASWFHGAGAICYRDSLPGASRSWASDTEAAALARLRERLAPRWVEWVGGEGVALVDVTDLAEVATLRADLDNARAGRHRARSGARADQLPQLHALGDGPHRATRVRPAGEARGTPDRAGVGVHQPGLAPLSAAGRDGLPGVAMTPAALDLARTLVALPGFEWRPGMRFAGTRITVVWVGRHHMTVASDWMLGDLRFHEGMWQARTGPLPGWGPATLTEALPDLDHDGTAGALLAWLRTTGRLTCVSTDTSGPGWWIELDTDPYEEPWIRGETLGEAVASALVAVLGTGGAS
jgi:hypothetical protein